MSTIDTKADQDYIMELNICLDALEADLNPLSQGDEVYAQNIESCIESARANLPQLTISTELPYPESVEDIKILAALLRDAHILSHKEAEIYGSDDPPRTIVVHAHKETVDQLVMARHLDFFRRGPYPWISYVCTLD